MLWVVIAVLVSLAAHAAPLMPPTPGETEPRAHDWLQLTNGEWLKGSLKRVNDEKVHFESAEFGVVKFSWLNVATLDMSGPVVIRLSGKRDYEGGFDLRDGVIVITTATEVVKATPDEVIGIIPGTGAEIDFWSASASFGLGLRKGNTNQTDITARAGIRRQSAVTRFTVDYLGDFAASGTPTSATTANSHRVPLAFDVWMTQKFFFTLPSAEYYTDAFQNLKTRATVGGGLGYEVLDRKRVSSELTAGAGYQYTQFNSVQAGSSRTANDANVYASITMNFDLPRGIEWDNFYKVQFVVTDFDKTSQHMESVLSFDIWGPLDFDASFFFDRIEQPVANSAGVTPLSNDYRLTMGFGIDI